MNFINGKMLITVVIGAVIGAVIVKFLMKDKVNLTSGTVKSSFIGFDGAKS